MAEQDEMANQICGRTDMRPTDRQIRLHIGRRLKHRRTFLGMTQQCLARSVGICFQQIPKYESGANGVSASRLYQLSVALHVPVMYFFDGLPDATHSGVLPGDGDAALNPGRMPAALPSSSD